MHANPRRRSRVSAVVIAVALASVPLTGLQVLGASPSRAAVTSCSGTGATFAGGTGTTADPYLVATQTQLAAITGGYLSCSFEQTATIALAGSWTPIGSVATKFTGEYDGAGFSITGLSINAPSSDYQGLFGYIGAGAVVENLTIAGSVTGDDEVGGLAGEIDGASIRNVTSSVAVTGRWYVGGIAGTAANAGTQLVEFTDVEVRANVVAEGAAGGLIGDAYGARVLGSRVDGDVTCRQTGAWNDCGGLIGFTMRNVSPPTPNSVIEDVSMTGDVEGGGGNLGGLIGYAESTRLARASFQGTVTGPTASTSANRYVGGAIGFTEYNGDLAYGSTLEDVDIVADVSGADFIGGLIGTSNGDTITDATFTGTVSGVSLVAGLLGGCGMTSVTESWAEATVSGTDQVGGLAGYCDAGTSFTRSWSSGSVSGSGTSASQEWLGGLVGYLDGGSITDCYSRSSVTGKTSLGGLVGVLEDSTLTRSFATGAVTDRNSPDTPDTVGGLVGVMARSTVTASFWDTQTSGKATSAAGTGATTAELQLLQTFLDAGWSIVEGSDCSSTWGLMASRNDGYPYLQAFFARSCSDTSQLPPSWYLSRIRDDGAECPSQWSPSWAQWPNGGAGGFVCNQEIYWDLATNGWATRW